MTAEFGAKCEGCDMGPVIAKHNINGTLMTLRSL